MTTPGDPFPRGRPAAHRAQPAGGRAAGHGCSFEGIHSVELPRQLEDEVACQPHPLVFMTLSGAHLYGFPSQDSDFDLRGAHVAPVRDVLSLSPPKETVERDVTRDGLLLEVVTHDVRKFVKLLLNANGYVLEQLYSPLVIFTGEYHERLKILARGCITRRHHLHYLGFANNEWRLLQKDAHRRLKRLLYTYRVLLTGIHLMRTSQVEANLRNLVAIYGPSHVEELIARKVAGAEREEFGDEDLAFHRAELDGLSEELVRSAEQSRLPETPTTADRLNDFVIEVRLDQDRTHHR